MNVDDIVAWADEATVPGRVVAVTTHDHVRVLWPNGEAEVPAADLVVLRAASSPETGQ